MNPPESPNVRSTPQLGVWDGVSIIIGIVVGVTIFKAPPLIFANVSGPWQGLGAWVLGGVLSLIGALCYAELASTYPRSGGDYVYLTRAFGPMVGFLFGWAQLSAILTGSIGAMAYVFSDYAAAFWQADSSGISAGSAGGAWLAAGAVGILTLMNAFGVLVSKRTQNLLTLTKVLGLAAILVAGLLASGSGVPAVAQPMSGPGFGLAMIFVLYAYGGWNDAAFVAADVRDPQRNIVRVLLLGTASIAAVYVLINAAFLAGLGFEGARASSAPATDILEPTLGVWGTRGMGLLVMASALGAINGLIFTGSRIYTSVGADHRLFARLGHWHPRLGAPIWSLTIQATFALSMILVVGTRSGQALLDSWMMRIGLEPLPWDAFGGGFDTLVTATAPVFWSFFLLTGISLFVLRAKDRGVERPFSVPLYPIVPCLFCSTSVYMLWSAVSYARELALVGVVPVLFGIVLYAFSRRGRRA